MAGYLRRYVTPWLKRDVNDILGSPQFQEFQKWPFLGLHVRRGDKVEARRREYHSCEVKFGEPVV